VTAYEETLQKHGIEAKPEYFVSGRYVHTEIAEELTERLLSLPNPPTCIIMPDDFAAIGGMNAIIRHGLSIPDDISIIGYDGSKIAEVVRPALTTFRQHADLIGKEAARRLLSDIKKEARENRVLTVSGELIAGKSVKKLN
jgi:DNA-binding LacI/PurR family transcriptional regulator